MAQVAVDVQEEGAILLLVDDVILDDLVVHGLARGDNARGAARARVTARGAPRGLRAIAFLLAREGARATTPGVAMVAADIMIARVLREREFGERCEV